MPKEVGIEIDGFDELEKLIQDMQVTPQDLKSAMKEGIEPVYEDILKNTPEKTKKLKKSTKMSVKIKDMSAIGEIKANKFYAGFLEYGTSKDKSNVGYFSRPVEGSIDESIKTIGKKLLEKAR